MRPSLPRSRSGGGRGGPGEDVPLAFACLPKGHVRPRLAVRARHGIGPKGPRRGRVEPVDCQKGQPPGFRVAPRSKPCHPAHPSCGGLPDRKRGGGRQWHHPTGALSAMFFLEVLTQRTCDAVAFDLAVSPMVDVDLHPVGLLKFLEKRPQLKPGPRRHGNFPRRGQGHRVQPLHVHRCQRGRRIWSVRQPKDLDGLGGHWRHAACRWREQAPRWGGHPGVQGHPQGQKTSPHQAPGCPRFHGEGIRRRMPA